MREAGDGGEAGAPTSPDGGRLPSAPRERAGWGSRGPNRNADGNRISGYGVGDDLQIVVMIKKGPGRGGDPGPDLSLR